MDIQHNTQDNIQETETKLTKQFFTFVYTMVTLIVLIWFLGTANTIGLRILFPITGGIMLIMRVEEFYRKKYMLFFMELCYFVFVWSIIGVVGNYDIKYVYVFLHGPLIWFSIINSEAYAPHNLNKVTSYVIHNFGALITCCIYLNGDDILTLRDLPYNFFHYFAISLIIFGCWYVSFTIFLFTYTGTGMILLRHRLKIQKDQPTPFEIKVKYSVIYLVALIFGLAFGVLSLHCKEITIAMIILSILSGLLQTAWYYRSGSNSKEKLTLKKFFLMIKNFVFC